MRLYQKGKYKPYYSMPQNQLISVLIRTYKSAKTLNEALSGISLKHGDEIIIVDSGSTDATLHIAETYGAQIINAPRPFHYSKSLNLGFKAAKNHWFSVHTASPKFLIFLKSIGPRSRDSQRMWWLGMVPQL